MLCQGSIPGTAPAVTREIRFRLWYLADKRQCPPIEFFVSHLANVKVSESSPVLDEFHPAGRLKISLLESFPRRLHPAEKGVVSRWRQ
jgi:hypothetical protein